MCSFTHPDSAEYWVQQTLLNGTGRVVVVLNETNTDVCMYT